jgi:hypothetical protein
MQTLAVFQLYCGMIWQNGDILALHRIVFSLKKTIVCNFRVNMLAVPGYYGMHFVKRCHYPIKNFTEPVIYITLYKLLTVIQGFLALIILMSTWSFDENILIVNIFMNGIPDLFM